MQRCRLQFSQQWLEMILIEDTIAKHTTIIPIITIILIIPIHTVYTIFPWPNIDWNTDIRQDRTTQQILLKLGNYSLVEHFFDGVETIDRYRRRTCKSSIFFYLLLSSNKWYYNNRINLQEFTIFLGI